MVTEHVQLLIKDGLEAAFETAMRMEGLTLLGGAEGCDSVSLLRGIEHPRKYLLLLQWTSLDAHTAFTRTSAFQHFRDIAGPYFSERPAMEHFSSF